MENTRTNPIVLLTDFGLSDGFVGVLKGVIAGISPDSKVIDLSHGVAAQDVLQAAFLLYIHADYFQKGTIFCVVVDPGVGSERKAICIRTSDFYFIGPDNGVLWPAADANGIKEIRELNNPGYFLDSISHTFHGRDIFAPAAAHLSARGADISRLGPVMDACHTIGFPEPKEEVDLMELTVLYKDRFGNLTLNLRHGPFQQAVREGSWQMVLNGHPIEHLHLSYSRAEPDQLFLIPASSGFMEVSVKNADAAEYLGAQVGDRAKLYLKRGG